MILNYFAINLFIFFIRTEMVFSSTHPTGKIARLAPSTFDDIIKTTTQIESISVTKALISVTKLSSRLSTQPSSSFAATSSPSASLTSSSSTTPCKNTRICETYSGDFCKHIVAQRNTIMVARNCSQDIRTLDNQIKQIFQLLTVYKAATSNCVKAAEWLICSTVFPPCKPGNNALERPCQAACAVIEDTICKTAWEAFVRIHETLQLLAPACDTYSVATNCSYPQHIKDLIPTKRSRKPINRMMIVGISVTFIILIFIFISIAVKCWCSKRTKPLGRTLSMAEIKEVHRTMDHGRTMNDAIGKVNPEFENVERLVDSLGIRIFTKENLTFDLNLGEGAFGKVVKCKTRKMPDDFNIELVAVKYLKLNDSQEMEATFRKEVEILSNFDHPNVIPLVGVCIESDGPLCLVLEFMKHGDLSQYIRMRSGSYHAVAGSYGNLPDGVEFQSPELSFHNLLLITSQIADGVSYLAAKRFVHRDIATRNILVGQDLRVKISDFGLAHDIYGSDYYRVDTQKMLPLRWLSPEALSLGKFTVYSDIWAFGVLMWEIFTYGMQPFYGCNNEEVCQRIRCHKFLERPYCCPQKIYELMKSCWKFETTHRKNCSYVRDTISTWLTDEEPFIRESWQRLLLPPLPDRRPTIKKAKLKYLNIRTEFTL